MTRLRAPSLGYLNTRRTSSNDGTLLALDWDLFVRPEGGMVNYAFEFVDAGPNRQVSLSSKACADDKILGFSSPAVRCLDSPMSIFSFELSIDNNTLKSCLALNVENPIAGIEIIAQIVVIRVVVWPIVSGASQLSTSPTSKCGTNALMTSGILS